MKPLNLQEAAQFLRMSKSSLYQRKDIPRYRRPGSRTLLFDQDELEAWVRIGRIEPVPIETSAVAPPVPTLSSGSVLNTLDIQKSDVYHRTPRYR